MLHPSKPACRLPLSGTWGPVAGVLSAGVLSAGVLSAGVGCLPNQIPEPDAEQAALVGVKAYVDQELSAFAAAAVALQAAAPAAGVEGWGSEPDLAPLRARWKEARISYEHIEGAIAVLFPDLDVATDARYDDFIADAPDQNLFDGEGVTGVHAIERIAWADAIPANVVEFESGLPGYAPAAFPSTAAEAQGFGAALCARLVTDTARMRDDFAPLALDPATAYRGVIGSLAEQVEKVALAGLGQEESRYAQFTLADMRANLEGGAHIFSQFGALLQTHGEEGAAVQDGVDAKLTSILAAYDAIGSEALPPVPNGFDPTSPSAAHADTAYGRLHALLEAEVSTDDPTSLVGQMLAGADLLGIPQLPE